MRRHDPLATLPAFHPEVLQALQAAALALPVADRVANELQLAGAAEVGEREDAREDGLETRGLALLGQQVHLQEPLVGAALHVDQIGKIHEGTNLREILPLGGGGDLSHSGSWPGDSPGVSSLRTPTRPLGGGHLR
jgi:hypothetical protein